MNQELKTEIMQYSEVLCWLLETTPTELKTKNTRESAWIERRDLWIALVMDKFPMVKDKDLVHFLFIDRAAINTIMHHKIADSMQFNKSFKAKYQTLKWRLENEPDTAFKQRNNQPVEIEDFKAHLVKSLGHKMADAAERWLDANPTHPEWRKVSAWKERMYEAYYDRKTPGRLVTNKDLQFF